MLMVRVSGDVEHGQLFAAMRVEGLGRAFSEEQAQDLAAQNPTDEPRYLLRFTSQTEQFGPAEPEAAPTMGMLPGETIWSYGLEPPRIDLQKVFQDCNATPHSLPSPEGDHVPFSIDMVIEYATERFGPGDRHMLENVFDRYVASLNGKRYDDIEPPCYGVPLASMGLA